MRVLLLISTPSAPYLNTALSFLNLYLTIIGLNDSGTCSTVMGNPCIIAGTNCYRCNTGAAINRMRTYHPMCALQQIQHGNAGVTDEIHAMPADAMDASKQDILSISRVSARDDKQVHKQNGQMARAIHSL